MHPIAAMRNGAVWLVCAVVGGAMLIGCLEQTTTGGPTDTEAADVVADVADSAPADATDASPDAPDVRDAQDAVDVSKDTVDTAVDSDSPDTGPCAPDASADRDGDGLRDCKEATLCTDPLDGDTDGDGLSDIEELGHGTDPCDADTDGDGVSDYREIQAGLDPTDKTTFGDTLDSQQWLARACRENSPREVKYNTSGPGNWTIALPNGMSNYQTLPIPIYSAPPAVGFYGDPLRTIAGMVLAVRAPDGNSSPIDALDGPLRQAIGARGEITLNYLDGTYTTHEGKLAANLDLEVTTDTPTTAKKLREQILYSVSSTLEPGDVQNLPSTVGPEHTKFRIEATALRRRPASRPANVLYSINIVPSAIYRSRASVERAIDDLSNGSHLADASASALPNCHRQELTTQQAKVDFYWMMGSSASVSNAYDILKPFVGDFTAALKASRIDHRFAVSQPAPFDDGLTNLPPGWHRDANTFKSEIIRAFKCDTADPTSRWLCDGPPDTYYYPLQNAWEGIGHMKGVRPSTPTPDETLRTDAELFTIIFEGTIADGPKRSQAVKNLPAWSTVFSYIPYKTTDHDNDDHVCGGAFYGRHNLEPYKKVAADSGGAFLDPCVFHDGKEMLDRIFEKALAETSAYNLPKRPISSTLEVYMNGNWVPRSEDDGYTYSSGSNALVFHGSYLPSRNIAESGAPSLIAVHYDTFIAGCKATGSVDTCARP